MGFYYVANPIDLNRINTPLDLSSKIKQYGENNLYPQIVNSMLQRSPLTKSAVKILSDFYTGGGFTSQGEIIVNRFNQSLNDVLGHLAKDLAKYRGFACHLNFNPSGQVVEMQPIPFEYCRLGLPNKSTGLSNRVVVSNNWEKSTYDLLDDSSSELKSYPLYDPQAPVINNRGAIYYYSDAGVSKYPLCSFDPILDNCQADAEIQLFEVNNLTNGFHSGTIFKFFGHFESDRQKEDFLSKVDSMLGAKGGSSTMVVEMDEALTDANLVEPIPANNNDTLFTQTTINIRNRVLQYFNIPAGLMGIAPEGAVFTVTELPGSYTYMNLRTANDRKILERFFNMFVAAGPIIVNSFEDSLTTEQAEATEPAPEVW